MQDDEIAIDCRDPARLAAFWCEVVGFVVAPDLNTECNCAANSCSPVHRAFALMAALERSCYQNDGRSKPCPHAGAPPPDELHLGSWFRRRAPAARSRPS